MEESAGDTLLSISDVEEGPMCTSCCPGSIQEKAKERARKKAEKKSAKENQHQDKSNEQIVTDA
ncbi:hypothetical protein N0V90_012421 [Kalmusia sp. IMI 367209]|nr:hypothetical protein N0V90_012421 [Kalmusia sp. IMI 367209]